MEKNKVIAIAVGTLIIGLVIGAALGGRGDRDGRFGMERDNRGNVSGQAGTHMMPNGEMMSNGMPMDTESMKSSMNMADMMTSMNASLKGKTGDALDQAFLSEMIIHHQGAVEMAQLALTNAKHQEIKDLAKAIIEAQNKEIAQMKAWQQAWYPQQ